jgi:hypothetical protein
MKQLKVSLPDALRDALDAAAAKSGLSLGEQIRLRLERTFAEDAIEPHARELAEDVLWLADKMSSIGIPWYRNDRFRAALAAAISAWLETQPKPVRLYPEPRTGPGLLVGWSDMFAAELDPPTVGTMLARDLYNFKRAIAESNRELRERHSNLQKPGDES